MNFKRKLIAAALLALLGVVQTAALAADTLVGVSWSLRRPGYGRYEL